MYKKNKAYFTLYGVWIFFFGSSIIHMVSMVSGFAADACVRIPRTRRRDVKLHLAFIVFLVGYDFFASRAHWADLKPVRM